MKTFLAIPAVLGAAGMLLAAAPAQAHCDSVDGPVATAAIRALDTKNVALVLPYAPAASEAEMTSAFNQAIVVRDKGPEARSLADRYFMEAAVRLHRMGENAAYTGLKPAGIDHGPAIPAAEKAIGEHSTKPLLPVLTDSVTQGLDSRLEHVLHAQALEAKTPTVANARQRVSAELEFVTYAEGIYAATKGGAHAE